MGFILKWAFGLEGVTPNTSFPFVNTVNSSLPADLRTNPSIQDPTQTEQDPHLLFHCYITSPLCWLYFLAKLDNFGSISVMNLKPAGKAGGFVRPLMSPCCLIPHNVSYRDPSLRISVWRCHSRLWVRVYWTQCLPKVEAWFSYENMKISIKREALIFHFCSLKESV